MEPDLKNVDVLLPFEQKVLRGDYKEYFKTRRSNFLTSVQQLPQLWDCFQLLDEIWLREINDLERLAEPNRVLPLVLFMYAHAECRVARELGFSGCVGEAWNMIRSGIEAVAHPYKLHREPRLIKVWTHKDEGKAQRKAFREAFLDDKRENLFSSEHGLEDLHRFYSKFSEWGTHSTLGALSLRVTTDSAPPNFTTKLNYFEGDLRRIALYSTHILNVSSHMEKAFFNCFDSRLKLDPQLFRMRAEFTVAADQANAEFLERFEIPSGGALS